MPINRLRTTVVILTKTRYLDNSSTKKSFRLTYTTNRPYFTMKQTQLMALVRFETFPKGNFVVVFIPKRQIFTLSPFKTEALFSTHRKPEDQIAIDFRALIKLCSSLILVLWYKQLKVRTRARL